MSLTKEAIKKMTPTEKAAYKWLASQGHDVTIYRTSGSPDFETESGKLFEVKRFFQKSITFGRGQLLKLRECNATILVFEDNSPEPLAIIPVHQVGHPPTYWKNIKIRYNLKDNIVLFSIPISPELKEWVEKKAREATTSGSAVIRQILIAHKNSEEKQCSG